jgi:medium-chain acyl-[acyl-carrier-protein] hydrolase
MEISLSSRHTFRVRSYEADNNNNLKISSVFNFMQVAAGLNADRLGFGYEQLTQKGYFWVLSRVILQWNGNVRFDEEIIIETFPKGVEKLFALRDFNIFSARGEKIGKATTAWLLMELETLRPLLLRNDSFELPKADIEPAIIEVPGKIDEPEVKTFIDERKAVYSDIDVNQHVNNAKYLEYVFDALNADLRSQLQSFRIQINYLREIKLGETFKMYYGTTKGQDNRHYLEALNENGQKIFQCSIIMR